MEESTICQTEDQTPSQPFNSFGDFYGFFETLVEESRDENRKIELHIFPKKPFEKATYIEVKTIQKLQLNDNELPDQPKFNTTTQNFQVLNTTTKKPHEKNGGQTSSYRTTVPEQQSAITVEDDNQNKVNEYSWRYSKELDGLNTQNNASVRDLTNKNSSLEIGENSQQEENCSTITYHYILDDDLDSFDNSNSLMNDVDSSSTVHSNSAKTNDVPILITSIKLEKEDFHPELLKRQAPGHDLPSNNSLESQGRRKSRKPGRPRKYRSKVNNLSTFEGLKQKGRPKGSLNKKAKFNKHLWETVEIPDYSRSRRVDELTQKTQKGIDDQTVHLLQEEFIPSKQLACSGLESAHSYQLETNNVEKDLACDESSSLNQIMITDTRSIAEQQFAGNSERNKSDEISLVYDNNSSGYEGVYEENNLNEEQLQNVATFQLVNNNSLQPNTTEKLDNQALKLSEAIEKEQIGKQQRNEVPSSENTVVIENVFGDVIYVVAEGSRYDIQKEDGSIKNTKLNSSSTSLILNNSSTSFQNQQEQLQPIYTLINTYPTGIVKNAYATLANSNVAGDIHDGQQTLNFVVCENQLPHFNSLLENNLFTCLPLEPNRSYECEAKQTLSKRKHKTVNSMETPAKRQKYSTMRKTNVHLLNRWNKNTSKRKKGQSHGPAGSKHSKIGLKVEQFKTKKKSTFSNESRKSKVKINQLLKRGPGRRKQCSTELINEKKKRGRPSKSIASELNFSQEKIGNINQNNESVSTAFNKRTWKNVSKLKSNDKLEKLKAKVVTKQKGRNNLLPKKRGVGRPRKKIEDRDIKLNTTKNLTPLKLHFNKKYLSFEDSTVTVSNDIPIADGLKDETFAEIKKKRGRPKKNEQIMSAIDTEILPDELHSKGKQVSLIEKGKFLDFWETKRAKRQTNKFPFKMRGKHKVVTLMNLEIPLQRISKDIKPKIKRHVKGGRGRPKLKHKGPKTKNSKLLAIQSKDVNVIGSTSSISNYTEIVVSQENNTDNTIDTAGNGQSNIQNQIAIGNTRITNESEIKVIEAEHTTETIKVLKENNCEPQTAPIIRTEQSMISTDGQSITEFHGDPDKNNIEFYKCQNLSENSEESQATENKKSGNGNGNEIAVRQPVSESKDFEKSYLELNVVPVNGNKDVVVKNLDISVSLVSKELIVKPIKERSSLALNFKCLNAPTKLSKPDISRNFNTPDKLEKVDYEIGISTESEIGPAIISNKNESPIQAVKIPNDHRLESSTASIGPISQNDTQADSIKLLEETHKSGDTAASQYKLQSFKEDICSNETGNAQLLTTEHSSLHFKSINNSSKKTVGRPRKQTFDNVKNDSLVLHIDTKFREKEKVLETITITKKKGRPPKSAKQHCKSEVLSVQNILPFKHDNVLKKKLGRPKKGVIQSINHSVNTKKTSEQINVRNKSIYLKKNLIQKSNIDSEDKNISAHPSMVAVDANYACRHQKKIDGVHQNKESLTDNDFTNSLKKQSGNVIHCMEETPTVRWEETDKKCFKLVKPQNSSSPNENIHAKYNAENVTIKIKRRNNMQVKHKAFSHTKDSCRNRKFESGNSSDATELTTNLSSNVNELNVYEERGEQPDQSIQLNEIAGFYFPKTINGEKNYCDTANSTIRNKGFIDDCVTAVASCSNADKVECSLKNDETEMEKLEIVITDNFVKKRGRPPKMPVLTMENMENMFDKIKKGREKKTKLTDLDLVNGEFFVNSDMSPSFPFDKTEENQNLGLERPKKKQTVENKDYISTIRHCLDVKVSTTKRKLNSFKNAFVRSKKAGSQIENAHKILLSAETINDNLNKLVDVQETRTCDSLMFQKKSRGRPKTSKAGYHIEPYMYCGDVARKKDGRGRPKKSFESRSFNNIVRNVKTISCMKTQRINKRENEKDENTDSQTVKAGKGRKKKAVESVFQNLQRDGRKCQGDEFKHENDTEAKGLQTYSILEDFTDSNNQKLDLITGSNSYSLNSYVKKSVVRPLKRVNIESSIVFDRKHGKNKTLMKISRRGRPKKLLVKEIHQDQSFNQETFKQPGKQYKFATKTGLDRHIKEFSKEIISTDIVQKQTCDRVYETDSSADEIRKECDEKISENMLNTGIFKTKNVCNSISSNKDKGREQFPKDVNIKKRKNFSKLKPTCATAELIKRRRPKKSKKISYEDILDKIRLHAQETPTKKTKRGRPKKAAKLVECEKQVLKSNPEDTVLPPTKVKTQKNVSKVGNLGAQCDKLFNSKDFKQSQCIATYVRPSKEKPNNLYSIGNIEKISGIKKTTGNVYVDNETFLKLKQLAGTKTEKNSCHKSNNTLQLKKMADSLINTERNIVVPEDGTKASQTKQCFECLTNDLTSHSTQNDMQQDNLNSSLNMLNDCSPANSTKEVLNEELIRLKCNYEVIFDINDTLAQRNDNVISQSTTCISP